MRLRSSVDYATVDGTASAGADYDAVSGTLVFEPGERTVSIAVPLLDDALDEPDESFVLLLSNPVGADLATESATGTIHDDDEAPTLSVGDAEGGEDIGDLVFDVVLSAASARTVTLRYATADRTATSGDDYRQASGTLTFVPGQTVGSIRVAVVDDALHELDETFELVLSDPTAAVLATPSAAGTIRDDDAAPTLSVGDAEGGEDIGDLVFDVVLSAASARTVTLRYATADRTATSDKDYRRASGTLTFVPGDTAGSIRVAVIDDSLHEPDETLELVLSEPTAAVLATPSAVGTIRDDDDAPTLSVGDAEGGEDIGDLVFDVVLSAASTRTVTLRYATADRTATSDEDYRRASGTLTFVPGDTAGSIRVAVIDDSLHEPDETFELVLSEPTAAELATPSAVGTIRDDDDAPTLSVGDAEGGEDIGDLVFDVVLSAASARTVTLRYATADRTATSDEDYRRASGTLTFVPGDTAGSIRVAVIDDSLHEPDETLELVLSEPTAAVLATPSAVGTIRDDDDAPTLSVGDAEGGEDIGDLVFDVVLSAASARTVTLRYATADRTATSDEDYRRASGTLTFVPGDTAGSIRVAVIDDSLREPDETFELVLSEPTAAVLATPSATGTIHDDDLSPPAPSAQLPDVLLCVGGAAHEADLASHFSGDPLTFSVLSSGSDVAAVTLVGSALAVEPVSEGEMAVTVTAVNEAGEARAEFAVRVVTDPTELAALDGAMASIGRGILAGAASSIDARFQLAGERTTDRSPGSSRWDPRHGTTAPVHGTRSADPGALPFGSAGPGGPLAGGEAGHGYGERQPSPRVPTVSVFLGFARRSRSEPVLVHLGTRRDPPQRKRSREVRPRGSPGIGARRRRSAIPRLARGHRRVATPRIGRLPLPAFVRRLRRRRNGNRHAASRVDRPAAVRRPATGVRLALGDGGRRSGRSRAGALRHGTDARGRPVDAPGGGGGSAPDCAWQAHRGVRGRGLGCPRTEDGARSGTARRRTGFRRPRPARHRGRRILAAGLSPDTVNLCEGARQGRLGRRRHGRRHGAGGRRAPSGPTSAAWHRRGRACAGRAFDPSGRGNGRERDRLLAAPAGRHRTATGRLVLSAGDPPPLAGLGFPCPRSNGRVRVAAERRGCIWIPRRARPRLAVRRAPGQAQPARVALRRWSITPRTSPRMDRGARRSAIWPRR